MTKRWACAKVATVKFTPGSRRHVVGRNAQTCCQIDITSTVEAFPEYNGSIEDVPLNEVSCIQCLRLGGYLKRYRKGSCLVAQLPGRKPVHLIRSGAQKPVTAAGCKLDFSNRPNDVRRGTYHDITCARCLLEAVELPWS